MMVPGTLRMTAAFHTCVLVLLLALVHLTAQAQVVYREVVATGSGGDAAKATLDALENAISQVGGMKLSTSASLSMSETATGGTKRVDESFRQDIERITRGVVKSYAVLETGTSPTSGRSVVKIRAVIPTYQASDQLKRLRLAVLPLMVAGPAATTPQGAEFAEATSAALEAFLTQTRKFAMIDRRYTAAGQSELQRVQNRSAPIEETVKVGMRVGADYMVLAALKEYSAQTGTQQRLSGRMDDRTTVAVAVDVRVIDVATGQIKFAQTHADTRRLLAGQPASRFAADVGEDIAQVIATAIYPIAVVAASGSAVTLNQGGDTLRVGRLYRVVRLGPQLFDPHTRESLGPDEADIARIQITSVTDRTAMAKVVDGQLPAQFSPGSLLARLLAEEPPPALPMGASGSTEPRQSVSTGSDKSRDSRDAW